MDSDRNSRRTLPRLDQAPEPPRSAQRFWLEYHGRKFELRTGEILIGRSSNCHLVLDDGLVSRRHAQIVVTEERAAVQDFGSANGVFVNNKRINGSEALKAGDQLQIGKQQFAVCSVARPPPPAPADRRNAETLQNTHLVPDASRVPISGPRTDIKAELRVPEVESTQRAEALELLGGVADKVLALGRGEEAERVLAAALNNLLSEAKRGRDREPPARVVSRAATYAGKLAEATSHGKWLDYTVELYASLRRPMPIEVVDQMYAVLRRVDAVNLPALRAYLSILHAQPQAYAPNERFAIQRLEGLERLVALK